MDNKDPFSKHQKRKFYRISSYPLKLLGYLFLFAGSFVGLILASHYNRQQNWQLVKYGYVYSMLIMTTIVVLCWTLLKRAKHLIHLGRQYSAISGEELLELDKRSPILYLRSFKDDALTSGIPSYSQPQAFSFLGAEKDKFTTSTEEEILAKYLMKIGPPIAIGIPSEKLPELGMARMYFSDDQWQSEVRKLMLSARFVIMRAGDSEGFWTELKMVKEHLNPTRLLILLPFSTGSEPELTILQKNNTIGLYTDFCKKAEKILGTELPIFHGNVVPGSTLSGAIWFDADWKSKAFAFEKLGKPIDATLKQVFKSINFYD